MVTFEPYVTRTTVNTGGRWAPAVSAHVADSGVVTIHGNSGFLFVYRKTAEVEGFPVYVGEGCLIIEPKGE